jgi:hypothetical protein
MSGSKVLHDEDHARADPDRLGGSRPGVVRHSVESSIFDEHHTLCHPLITSDAPSRQCSRCDATQARLQAIVQLRSPGEGKRDG